MDRKKFLKNTFVGLGAAVTMPVVITSCDDTSQSTDEATSCESSPNETAGPFPIKTPAELVRANIVSDRLGVALLITLTIQDSSNNCSPLSDMLVDLWHCDSKGDYSEYGGTQMQHTDYTTAHFLRGRQTSDANGQVSFVSIFPGWYSGRAPHLHVEIFDKNENSVTVTQIAFPKDTCDAVYATDDYKGEADTFNDSDNVFSDSLADNLPDSVMGNTVDGYTLLKKIVI